MRVIVTGGAGFIGANLCGALAAHPAIDTVVAFDDLSTGRRENLHGVNAELVVGTILDPEALATVCAGAHAIVHLAAIGSVPRSVADPLPTHFANATGTVNVLQAAREATTGGAQVVVAGSSSVYGANPALPKHEDLATRPLSPYAASKLATEAYALAWAASYQLPVMSFRFFNVFGPLQPADHAYAAVVPRFVAAALAGQPLTVHGDGTQSRDFTYVGTVAGVITDAVVRRVTSLEPVNLAFGTRHTLLQVIELLEQQLGRTLDVQFEPTRAGDIAHSQAAHHRLDALFPGVVPVSLADGLRATVQWMAGRV
ncbi:MAG: NAD-dependent epimerase/dehydratase family protein [Actinomycetota bacterium]|nr:NAD-dependent epimerase/dehydratase family protein [Actinomycetota bacterium]